MPSPAFSEAMARLAQTSTPLAVLDDYWSACAAAATALADTAVWHWLYEHPEAGPGDLEAAAAACARDVWNRYYAPVFWRKDCALLAGGGLPRPGHAIAAMIAYQIRRRIDQAGKPDETLKRCAGLGWLTPDLWLIRATGFPLGPEAMLEAAAGALQALESKSRASCRSGEGKASSP
jgi:hypothetical protein